MFLGAGEFIRNMEAEQDAVLHQRVVELEEVREVNWASLHFPHIFSKKI
jgi:hypothetical protein